MARFTGKLAAITGAGSGIGRCLALQMAKEGASLALSDMNEKGLEETAELVRAAQSNVHTAIVNVADEAAVQDWADAVKQAMGPVDLVFNNAGMTVFAPWQDQGVEGLKKVMDVNFYGVVYGCNAFLPHLREQGAGSLVNISSLFGLIGVPHQTGYNASKFAVRGFSESLGHELRREGLEVLSVHPGGIRTNIARNASFGEGEGSKKRQEKLVNGFDRMAKTTPEQAASIILNAVHRKDRRVLVGSDAWFLDKIQRLFPNRYHDVMGFLGV